MEIAVGVIIVFTLLLIYRYVSKPKKSQYKLELLSDELISDDAQYESFDNANGTEIYDYGRELFPVRDVEMCLDRVLPKEDFENRKPCPQCSLESNKLNWIKFTSPKETWKYKCGRSGALSICPNCNVQVEFIGYFMS